MPFKKQQGKQPQNCWNLNDSAFSRFIDNCEDNWVEKILS